jgi:transposase-like protein
MSENRKANGYYTQEFKELVLNRLEPPTDDTVASLSKELGVSKSAIYHWIRPKNGTGMNTSAVSKWSTEDKFHVVLETSTLTEQELAAYCRRKGLFMDDVKSWRKQCMNANGSNAKDPLELEENLKEERQKTKLLEKELRRKEKALAEAAALLVLQKKARAIWGDHEED